MRALSWLTGAKQKSAPKRKKNGGVKVTRQPRPLGEAVARGLPGWAHLSPGAGSMRVPVRQW
ncbi:hypothetical protein [Oleomonas cavernae]|uniref:hypothetical protein n=1 Tax=Oleomonas cavernae TaxID=2320859 RepID=UPI001314A2A8|nr:hypothetical protein [Oleomonas cavernae]